MRLIDADALIKQQIDKHDKKPSNAAWDRFVDIRDAVKAAPTINPAPVWTPCSEGTPEDAPGFSPMSRYECTIMIPDGTREVFTLHRTGNGTWLYETGKGLGVVRGDQVIAWKPQTEPYDPDHIVDTNKKVDPNKTQEA